MSKKKLISSHYTGAQICRILGIKYTRLRSVLVRVPTAKVSVYGTDMIPVGMIPKLRSVVQEIDRERAAK